jgi:hypothetical protein
VLRRLQALERLPQFQLPPSPLPPIRKLAVEQLSNEDLELMIDMTERGECQTLSPSELAVLATWNAVLETEARRMGFKSLADAERRAGKSR